MIFIIVFSTNEYESSSRPRTTSKNMHMITCEENENSKMYIYVKLPCVKHFHRSHRY